MTRDDFKTAQDILYKIEKIDEIIDIMRNAPFIGAERIGESGLNYGIDKVYVSWVDNDDYDSLKEIILDWCNNEAERLNGLLEEL